MGKTPKPPDPYATAEAQSNANFKNAQQNFGFQNINEYNPYGSKTYNQTGWYDVVDPTTGRTTKTPQYSSYVNLAPGEQDILNKNTAMRSNIGQIGVEQSGRLQQHLAQNFDPKDLQAWKMAAAPGAIRQDQGPTDRAAIEQAMMASRQRAVAPQQAAEDVQLAARGLSPGGQGYGTVQQGREDAASEATRQAYLASGGESRAAQEAYNAATQQRYQLGADWATQANQLHQAQMQEAMARRNQPINEVMALLGGAGVNTPQFQPFQGSTMQAPNIGQYIYDNYNAKAQQSANNMSGMFGVGSAVMGALPWASWLSDRRAKQDIEPFGASYAGVPLYWFRYKSDPTVLQVGVMADEVRLIHPDAVHVVDGYDHVDYELLRRRHKD
jgi:hypothetical protein